MPECQANKAGVEGRPGSLSGTAKYADKGITLCLRRVISNESCRGSVSSSPGKHTFLFTHKEWKQSSIYNNDPFNPNQSKFD